MPYTNTWSILIIIAGVIAFAVMCWLEDRKYKK